MRTSSSCYWHRRHRALGSAVARNFGSSFRACASRQDREPYALDPDKKLAALRNGHIGRGQGRRRGRGGGGGGFANRERPVDKDVRESSGDDYDNVDASTARNRRSLGIGRLAVRAAGRCMGNESHGCLIEEDSRGVGGEGDNVRAQCRALCPVCLSWDSTHPSNNINNNGAATMTMTGLLLFLRPSPSFLSAPTLPHPSLSVSLNYLWVY